MNALSESHSTAAALWRHGRAVFAGLCLTAVAACAQIPDVQPFAVETANLSKSSGTENEAVISFYEDTIKLSDEVLKKSDSALSPADRAIVRTTHDRLVSQKKSFENSSKAFDLVLGQAVVYSERLAELAAAGKTGGDAAKSLASTINGFGSLVGLPGGEVITGTVATILAKVADYATRVQARDSLKEAAAEAQGAVEEVGKALKEIHGTELQRLASSLASDRDGLLLTQAGPNIVGYYREASDRRDSFYGRALLALRLNNDGISGFCRDPRSGNVDPKCMTLKELKALSEVESRMMALKPEVEAYEKSRAEALAWRQTRRANGARIVKAVDAWVTEHRNVVAALEDGSGVSAFSLRAILAQIPITQ